MSSEAPTSASVYAAQAKAAQKPRKEICIVGGGFGGLYTALRLAKLPWGNDTPHITLIDKRDKFVFLPLLYDLAAGYADLGEVAPTFKSLLEGTGISFVQASVTAIDLPSKSIAVAGALCDDLNGTALCDAADETRDLPYDDLIIALGAEPVPDLVEGAREHALPFYTVEDAYRLQLALRALRARSDDAPADVVVVGGSLCGVEIAATIAGVLDSARITMVTRAPELLSAAAPANRAAGAAKMRALGVDVRTATSVESVAAGAIAVRARDGGANGEAGADDAETLRADLIVWTAGSRPNGLLRGVEGLSLDARGRVRVSATLAADGLDSVYCLGDAAAVDGADGVPATAQAAMQQSDYVAWNGGAAARRRQRAPLPFRYMDLGQMVSLGAADGTMSALGERVTLRGPAAAAARRAVYALRMPTAPQRAAAAASIAVNTAAKASSLLLDMGLSVLDKLMDKREQR
ncbi:NADH dehydrogenase [Tribonema minus]|uniref:NADH dehydrogenase n=1 Tax=Tribonema minus TaxID=303371 RepID=A0A836CDT3_9STRA|nr:NADH dehydrogenase [Tribonema minus]